jgi:hypothetical protein
LLMTEDLIGPAIKALKSYSPPIEGPAIYALAEKLEAALNFDPLIFKNAIEKDVQCVNAFLNIVLEAWNEAKYPDSLAECIDNTLFASLGLPEDALSWVLETAEAAAERNDDLGYSPLELVEIEPQDPAGRFRINYVFIDQRSHIGRILWDSYDGEIEDYFTLALAISTHAIFTAIVPSTNSHWAPPPLFVYHPERFKRTRRYITNIASDGLFNNNTNQVDMLNASSQYMLAEYNEQSMRVPLRKKLEAEDAGQADISRTIHSEIDSLLAYDQFRRAGRQIFDISKGMSDLLRQTTTDDIPVALLNSPYETYFIYFGPQHDIVSGNNWVVDGVYISHDASLKLIQFQFSSAPLDPLQCKDWVIYQEPTVTISIGPDNYDFKLGEAIRNALIQREEEIKEKISKGDNDVTDEIIATHGEGILSSSKLIETNATSGMKQLLALEKDVEIISQSLSLAVNAMCYITAYPDDIEKEYPAGTPQKMLEKTRTGPPKLKKNALSKLESMGYRKIHMCGRSLHKGPAINSPDSDGKKTHWRKGFWREQPHGPKNALRKLIWIKPVIVNPKKSDQPELGSIYIGENVVDFSSEKKKRL